MNYADLVKLGLSHTEARLYLALLEFGKADVSSLIRETGFYKSNTYDALERLCEKGIISKIIEGKKRTYYIEKPEAILDFIEKKKEDLNFQENLAKKIIKEVGNKKRKSFLQETAIVFKGIAGIKQIYSEILNEKLDYLVFGSPIESEQIIPDFYWQNLHVKQKRFNIKARMIFNKSLRHWKNMVPPSIIQLRFLDEKIEPLTETTIYGTKVAFTVWTENPSVTIIDNKHVSESYRQIFEILWKKSHP